MSLKSLAATLFLAAAVSAYDNGSPHARLPTMGWSSWIALGPAGSAPIFDFCDYDSVKNSIDAFVELGFPDHGYYHVHLDDCWAGGRNSTGYLYAELDHFPGGTLKPLIDYAHSFNLSFGLYTCAGNFTCVGGRPGSRDHWQQDADVWAEWGVDWVKMDWCNTDGMEPPTAYGNMSVALNNTGRHMAFNMCEWGLDSPWVWGDAVAQSWRMAGDHTGVWSSTKSTIAASAAIPASNSGQPYGWNDMDMLETGCYEQCAHANGRQPNMTAIEYMTEFSMWAISASPLLFTSPIMNCTSAPSPVCNVTLVDQLSIAACTYGTSFGCGSDNNTMWTNDGCRGDFICNGLNVTCDVDGNGEHICPCESSSNVTCTPWISDLQKQILFNDEVIAINQDVTPQGRPINGNDLSIWARVLSDGSIAVAFYNQDDTPANINVDFSALPYVNWSSSTTVSVRDLWAHSDLGSFTGSYPQTGSVNVLPHQTHLVRMTKQ